VLHICISFSYRPAKQLLPPKYCPAQPTSVPDELKISAGSGLRYCYVYCKGIDYLLTLFSAPTSVLTTQHRSRSEYDAASDLVYVGVAQMLFSSEFMLLALLFILCLLSVQEFYSKKVIIRSSRNLSVRPMWRRVEYLHHSPTSLKRRRWNTVAGGITPRLGECQVRQ
jgi:hypothetical protein